jgi:hypothetical protein
VTVKLLSMDDVGTRLEHFSDLHELWSFALGILMGERYPTEPQLEQILELELALKLLELQMLTGYSATTYAQTINNLPKPGHPTEDIT